MCIRFPSHRAGPPFSHTLKKRCGQQLSALHLYSCQCLQAGKIWDKDFDVIIKIPAFVITCPVK